MDYMHRSFRTFYSISRCSYEEIFHPVKIYRKIYLETDAHHRAFQHQLYTNKYTNLISTPYN